MMSFKPTDIQMQSSAAQLLSLPPTLVESEFYSEQNATLHKLIDEVGEKTFIGQIYHAPQLKYKKKYRRWSSVSLGIRQPVRNLEARIFDSGGNTVYIKPFFLSHLHSFLFRLTPF